MKKFFIVMIFAISTLVVVGGNSVVTAQSATGMTTEQRDAGWVKWCIDGLKCAVGFICNELMECVIADDEGGGGYKERPMATCLNTNESDGCFQKCGVCGALSAGKGPVESRMHACLDK